LEVNGKTDTTRLLIRYEPAPQQKAEIASALGRIKKALRRLGCIVPPGMIHIRPMGASAHYAGTLPMSSNSRPYTTSRLCQSHDFDNLLIVDGAPFSFLPAKNVTFTLMANAVRVAEAIF
jgi:choline dehydrogenase-like flavoprotein